MYWKLLQLFMNPPSWRTKHSKERWFMLSVVACSSMWQCDELEWEQVQTILKLKTNDEGIFVKRSRLHLLWRDSVLFFWSDKFKSWKFLKWFCGEIIWLNFCKFGVIRESHCCNSKYCFTLREIESVNIQILKTNCFQGLWAWHIHYLKVEIYYVLNT